MEVFIYAERGGMKVLKGEVKDVLFVKQELVFECPECNMQYFIYAVIGESNDTLLNQEYIRYCPYCGYSTEENRKEN